MPKCAMLGAFIVYCRVLIVCCHGKGVWDAFKYGIYSR